MVMRNSIFRIQFASNLRVHNLPLKQSSQLLTPVSRNLALLGDIGLPKCNKTRDFFKWCESMYDTIYWVPGYLEFSDYEQKKHTWQERLDAGYESIDMWNLKKTLLCSKQAFYIQESRLELLLTPLWNQMINIPIYVKSNNGSKLLSKKDLIDLKTSEFDWLLRMTAYSSVPVAWLTYASPFNISAVNDISVDLPYLDHPKLVCSIRGKNNSMGENILGSSTNVKGSSSFITDAYWEYTETNPNSNLNLVQTTSINDRFINILKSY
jgi:hypothetical protein